MKISDALQAYIDNRFKRMLLEGHAGSDRNAEDPREQRESAAERAERALDIVALERAQRVRGLSYSTSTELAAKLKELKSMQSKAEEEAERACSKEKGEDISSRIVQRGFNHWVYHSYWHIRNEANPNKESAIHEWIADYLRAHARKKADGKPFTGNDIKKIVCDFQYSEIKALGPTSYLDAIRVRELLAEFLKNRYGTDYELIERHLTDGMSAYGALRAIPPNWILKDLKRKYFPDFSKVLALYKMIFQEDASTELCSPA